MLDVVLVDGDSHSREVTVEQLSTLGVRRLRTIDNYEKFSNLTAERPADLIIFDAGQKTEEELSFIRTLRQQADESAFAPLLALSQQTTRQDVRNIVDIGATELVAKPASMKHLLEHMQNIVDNPRSFIAGQAFKGPDRRRKQKPDTQGEGRMGRPLQVVTRGEYLAGGISGPASIMPDFSLKLKVGNVTPGDIPQKLEDEFILWVSVDVAALQESLAMLMDGAAVEAYIERICSACLSINARSNAYGYELGCEVAGMLREFCLTEYKKDEEHHIIILEKHIQVLSTIYHGRLRGDGGDHGQQLVSDLRLLVKKYAAS